MYKRFICIVFQCFLLFKSNYFVSANTINYGAGSHLGVSFKGISLDDNVEYISNWEEIPGFNFSPYIYFGYSIGPTSKEIIDFDFNFGYAGKGSEVRYKDLRRGDQRFSLLLAGWVFGFWTRWNFIFLERAPVC